MIMGYWHFDYVLNTAKYASAFYGPFRDAPLDSAPKIGDKKDLISMNPANIKEALIEAALISRRCWLFDVKPALAYLDYH